MNLNVESAKELTSTDNPRRYFIYMNKQLKIWREDFLRYWNRTSLIMRILIGAGISFVIIYAGSKYVTKPMAKEIKAIKKKLDDIAGSGVALQIQEMQRQKKELSRKLKDEKTLYENALDCETALEVSESGKVIIDLRQLLNECDVKLLNEEKLTNATVKTSKKKKKRGKKTEKKIDYHMRPQVPSCLSTVGYHFKVIGQFKNIKKFLLTMNSISHVFIANNIAINTTETVIYNKKLQPRHGVEMEFEVHIPYLIK